MEAGISLSGLRPSNATVCQPYLLAPSAVFTLTTNFLKNCHKHLKSTLVFPQYSILSFVCPPGSSVHEDSLGKNIAMVPCPPSEDPPNPGTESRFPTLQVNSLRAELWGKPLSMTFSPFQLPNVYHFTPTNTLSSTWKSHEISVI